PTGWNVGDTLALPGTVYAGQGQISQDELLTVKSIVGRTVYLSAPLQFDHLAPDPASLASQFGQAPPGGAMLVQVANLTRNARFHAPDTSQTENRGPFMVMPPSDADIEYAGFYGLGRSDKSLQISANNPRGRYALHIHMAGPDSTPVEIRGCVVQGSPG